MAAVETRSATQGMLRSADLWYRAGSRRRNKCAHSDLRGGATKVCRRHRLASRRGRCQIRLRKPQERVRRLVGQSGRKVAIATSAPPAPPYRLLLPPPRFSGARYDDVRGIKGIRHCPRDKELDRKGCRLGRTSSSRSCQPVASTMSRIPGVHNAVLPRIPSSDTLRERAALRTTPHLLHTLPSAPAQPMRQTMPRDDHHPDQTEQHRCAIVATQALM